MKSKILIFFYFKDCVKSVLLFLKIEKGGTWQND
nr:MAG TPA: hypothetical protein [Caudoviricetes sp.]